WMIDARQPGEAGDPCACALVPKRLPLRRPFFLSLQMDGCASWFHRGLLAYLDTRIAPAHPGGWKFAVCMAVGSLRLTRYRNLSAIPLFQNLNNFHQNERQAVILTLGSP